MIYCSQTFDVVTPESAEDGEAAETGFNFQSQGFTFRELVAEMSQYSEPSCSPIGQNDFWVTSHPEQDYRDGSYTIESLHLCREGNHPFALKYWRKAWKTVVRRQYAWRNKIAA